MAGEWRKRANLLHPSDQAVGGRVEGRFLFVDSIVESCEGFIRREAEIRTVAGAQLRDGGASIVLDPDVGPVKGNGIGICPDSEGCGLIGLVPGQHRNLRRRAERDDRGTVGEVRPLAVIVPAVKLPEASRLTIVPGVFAPVAAFAAFAPSVATP